MREQHKALRTIGKKDIKKKDINLKKQNITTFEEAVDYLYDVPRFTNKNTMEDTKAYLHYFGDPDKEMKIIHVAGTNGKGSVCAYLRYILQAAGYRTAAFTSPHLVDIRERFLVNGKMIEKQTFLDAFLQIYDSLDWVELEKGEGYHPTFFEYLFFMAMIIFSKEEIDYCILETGLGGRLDATNSVSRKELSVITRISLDHVEYLGNTIAEIAGEKAGIMQEGVPVVFTDAEEDATEVFCRRASGLGIPTHSVSKKDYSFLNFKNKSIDFSLRTRYYCIERPYSETETAGWPSDTMLHSNHGIGRFTLHTIARYQMENAALAVRAIEVLDRGRTITVEQIRDGLASCVWPGRMEEIIPGVYVDGAHNEDGIRAFLDTVREDGCEGGRSLLFSVVQDKDYEHMIQQLAESGLFDRIAIAHMHTGRAASLDSIRELFDKYPSCNYNLYTKVDTALQELMSDKGEKERIYIAGSLYLVGEIKESLSYD